MNSSGTFPQLWFYSKIDFIPFPKGFVSKILAICFIGTHLPLLAVIALMLGEASWADRQMQTAVVIVLLATFVGSAMALFAINAMLAPMQLARRALATYRTTGQLPNLPRRFNDAAGQLMCEVDITLGRLDNALSELAHEARIDPLTGIGNRRFIMENARERLNAARRTDATVSIAIIDVDMFKTINDTYGHPAGDRILTDVARVLQQHVGEMGSVGRLGGDEFCMVFSEAGHEEVVATLERVRSIVEQRLIPPIAANALSLSIGVASTRPPHETLTQLLMRADTEVYRAKDLGRNRVCASPAPTTPKG